MKENLDPNWMGEETEEDEIYKENILDHFRNPHNFGKLDSYTFKHMEFNPICGDQIEIFILLEDDKVKDVKFHGKGCAISMASTSMFTDKIKNITLEELKNITKEEVLKNLGIELGVVRRKCGLLSLRALMNGIHNLEVQNEQISH